MIAVFLGPTMPVEHARTLLDAVYLPPVARGDIYAIVARRPRAICIIDGYFERVPAVLHKEILYAMAEGIPVFGSSSMGALRAAELAPFGVVGIGQVFEAFRDGVLEDDDEVAVAHATAEFGYRSLSEAMVNIRFGLAMAQADGVVSPQDAETLTAAAKALFYQERCWPAVWQEARRLGVATSGLEAYIARQHPDAKRDDAITLLKHVSQHPLEPHRSTDEFLNTSLWNAMIQTDGAACRERMERYLNVV